MANNDQNSAIIEAGKRLGDPKAVPAGGDYAVLGTGDQVHDLEHLLDKPRRIRAAVQVHDTATFGVYFNRYKTEGDSAIFANRDRFEITGVLDYHASEAKPAWCSHRVTYTAPRSPEWLTWTGSNQAHMAQADFALFIENNVADIRTPAGATMLEVARGLQAKKAVEFASAIRLATGEQQFTYNETVQGTAQNGQMTVPEEFTIGIPVFVNDAPYEVRARLRYRIDGGKLRLWYDLYRPEAIEADAFQTIVGGVFHATNTPVWMGHQTK